MKPAIKWALIIGGVGVTGAVAYFIWKKMKRKSDENKSNNNISNSASSSSASSSSAIQSQENLPNTPFSSNTEGDAFRLWVNKNFPAYAKDIDLSLKGSFNNSYIKKAYDKYGKAYSFSLVPIYVGKSAILSAEKNVYRVDLSSRGVYVEFLTNGTYRIKKLSNRLNVQKGTYKLGGRIMKSDKGKSASSSSVFNNLYTLLS